MIWVAGRAASSGLVFRPSGAGHCCAATQPSMGRVGGRPTCEQLAGAAAGAARFAGRLVGVARLRRCGQDGPRYLPGSPVGTAAGWPRPGQMGHAAGSAVLQGGNMNKLCVASIQIVHGNRIAGCGARRSSYLLASTANVACGWQDYG
jgi:hypothetical protein